ncbi:glycosyltransferase family 4 protein [Pseudomonas panipatensis]|uniref:Alpha-1,2-rhamnosyltransferase n=1 Tax=Pseudomonas panipatensis TaxID=428992 RepID=A0A1G8LUV6_9PSED|nr:glycosyltransferase family 1 protein [Pseudomonas panipatensis]SDI59446.1 alpha-1,2-rhamnosyltransferase [Pseudomonas panipatensis]SMP47144.1 alpha-1,2-rhamnosyltransferase [Pseudomonas panipatensis]
MTRLLVECTYVFEHPDVNSGIQRVVRNVIRHLGEVSSDAECIPVVFARGQMHRVLHLAPLSGKSLPWHSRMRIALEQLRNTYWMWHARLDRRWPMNRSRNARRVLYVLCKLASLAITLPLRVALFASRNHVVPERMSPLEIQPGDQLLLLDSSWHADFFPVAERLKAQGVGIVSVIYDLIPTTHPQFCDAGLVRVFDHWFDWIAEMADGFICISTTIRDQVRDEIVRRRGEKAAQRLWFEHFYLGSELDLVDQTSRLDPQLVQMFDAGAPVYLMVSTIEPRKNHGYLLDAFERLWARGSAVRLCIIGRVGWKCDELMARIRRHPELNKRLFVFNKLNDRGLEHAYANARALVFPSFVEGFGLPLVEAMQRQLPVMASDIPVFREIGGEFMAYFDLAQPQTLADLVERFEASGAFPAARDVSEWRWIGWREASQQLIDRVLGALRPKRRPEPAEQGEPHAGCT